MKLPLLLLLTSASTLLAHNRFTEQCTAYFNNPLIHEQLKHVRKCTQHTRMPKKEITYEKEPPLFRAYPELKENIAYTNLGNFATPIEKMKQVSKKTKRTIFIKRDDQCGKINKDGQKLFGGNKVRKLEFLLADALHNNYRSVMTFGATGSNHSTATSSYANDLGLKCTCMLIPQPNSPIVRRNLLLHQQYKTTLHMCQTETLRELGAFYTCLRHAQKHNQFPYIIPTGGSCPIGILGIVNAAFELHEQIQQGIIPEPDYIYVPVGSMGTVTGLTLGTKLLGMKTKVIGIAVEPEEISGNFARNSAILFEQTYAFLKQHCSTLPNITLGDDDIKINMNYCGKAYGEPTTLANRATKLAAQCHDIILDPTYSSKGFAGMLDQCKHHKEDDIILYWYTFDGNNFDDVLQNVSHKTAPLVLQEYFE